MYIKLPPFYQEYRVLPLGPVFLLLQVHSFIAYSSYNKSLMNLLGAWNPLPQRKMEWLLYAPFRSVLSIAKQIEVSKYIDYIVIIHYTY